MKYTAEKAAQIIMERSGEIRNRREKNVYRRFASAAGALCVLLVALVAVFSGTGSAGQTSSVYGAFLLSANAGGYILVAVIAFAAGVVLTALVQRYRHRGGSGTEKN